MELKFNNVEEVLEFARTVNRHAIVEPGVVRPGNVDPAAFVEHLGRIASGNGKIAAIKLYRATFDVGLRDAKMAVERAPAFAARPVYVPAADRCCGDPECGCGSDVDDTPF